MSITGLWFIFHSVPLWCPWSEWQNVMALYNFIWSSGPGLPLHNVEYELQSCYSCTCHAPSTSQTDAQHICLMEANSLYSEIWPSLLGFLSQGWDLGMASLLPWYMLGLCSFPLCFPPILQALCEHYGLILTFPCLLEPSAGEGPFQKGAGPILQGNHGSVLPVSFCPKSGTLPRLF